MVTEATIFTFEWLFVLYGSFELASAGTAEPTPLTTSKKGKKVSVKHRVIWHAGFLIIHAFRITALVIQVRFNFGIFVDLRSNVPQASLKMARTSRIIIRLPRYGI